MRHPTQQIVYKMLYTLAKTEFPCRI